MSASSAISLIVEAELHGVRIDSFLIKHFRNYTSWRIQRIVAAGGVTVNHAPATVTQRVFVDEVVRVRLIEPPDKLLSSEPVPFRLVYRDSWLLVVDKPAGVVAHPTGEMQTGTLANGLQSYLDEYASRRGLVRPGLVHRLDRQTSGLMVVATHHRAHAELSDAFESGRVCKAYLAIVEGTITAEDGMIDWPIGRSRTGSRALMSARGDAVDPRPARTGFVVEERFREHTIVRATPATGRNHQIRVHFAQLGHPLLGDEFYDRHGTFKPWRKDGCDIVDSDGLLVPGRHALHATSLAFAHPVSGRWMTFVSPLPYDLRSVIERLRASPPESVEGEGQMEHVGGESA